MSTAKTKSPGDEITWGVWLGGLAVRTIFIAILIIVTARVASPQMEHIWTLWDTPDDLRDRRKNLRSHRLPHLVATSGGEVIGYAYVVLFRKRPAYRYTVKHSIYIHQDHLGRGVGRLLMQELIDSCAAQGFRQMIGYIDADNAASLAIHDRLGFKRVGLLPGVAYRFGRWADTVMVQRSLGAGTTEAPPPLGFGR